MAQHRVELEQAVAHLFEMIRGRRRFSPRARESPRPPWAGIRAAADRASGSSPAGPPSRAGCRRNPRAASAGSSPARARAARAFSARIISRTASIRSGREEHMLGAAQSDTFGAELARDLGVVRRVGVGAHAEVPFRVRPSQKFLEEGRHLRLDGRHASRRSPRRRAVERDVLAAMNHACRRPAACRRRSRSRSPSIRPRSTCPSRAPPPPHDWSSRRARSGFPPPPASRGCPRARSRCAPGSPCARPDCTATASSAREHDFAGDGAGRRGQSAREHVFLGVRDRVADGATVRVAPARRASARCARSMSFSCAISTAARTAASAVRLPLRVCSMKSLPRSMVNSMSCMSRKWCSSRAAIFSSSSVDRRKAFLQRGDASRGARLR